MPDTRLSAGDPKGNNTECLSLWSRQSGGHSRPVHSPLEYTDTSTKQQGDQGRLPGESNSNTEDKKNLAKGKSVQSRRAALQKPAGSEDVVFEETVYSSVWVKYGVTRSKGWGAARDEAEGKTEAMYERP